MIKKTQSHRVDPSVKHVLDDRSRLCEAVYLYGGSAQFARAIGISTPTLTYYYKKHGIKGTSDAKLIGGLSVSKSNGATQSIVNDSRSMIDFSEHGNGAWLPSLIIGLGLGFGLYALVMVVVK